ncbi:MAG TPA: hypothetical protein VIO61_13025 [Anaerolineaceae bacterium]
MDKNNVNQEKTFTRIGMHYFPDTLHYRESDIATWLPRLQSIGVSWLVLLSDVDRAIPESFLAALRKAQITPIIHFDYPPGGNQLEAASLRTLLEVYARWGVQYLIFFNRPNARSSWQAASWTQQDLVERFLDRYLPLAQLALQNGMIPVFPPLEPGGSYWDTAFLRSTLESLGRRRQEQLLKNMVLSAYAWTEGHHLNWGAGGPEAWTASRPYITPPGSQDQRGFRIYEWYQAVSKAVLSQPLPVILLQAGIEYDPLLFKPSYDIDQHALMNLLIYRLMQGEQVNLDDGSKFEPVDPQVLACNFFLLSANPESNLAPFAWYQGDQSLPAVQAIQTWMNRAVTSPIEEPGNDLNRKDYPIAHYLLLPTFEWGISDWHLDVIRPFIKKHQPTIGFSLDEAHLARRITVIGNTQVFPEETLQRFRQIGIKVERISGDGTSIASQLAGR